MLIYNNIIFKLMVFFISCLLFEWDSCYRGEFYSIDYFYNSKLIKSFLFFILIFVLLFKKTFFKKIYFLALFPPVYVSVLDESFDISLEMTEIFDQIKDSKAIYQDLVVYKQDILIFLGEIEKLRNLLESQSDFFLLFKESNNLENLKFKTPLLEPQTKKMRSFIATKVLFIIQSKLTTTNEEFILLLNSTKNEILESLISIQANYIDLLQEIQQQESQFLFTIKEILEFPKKEKLNFVKIIRPIRPENLLSDEEGDFFRGEDDVFEEVEVVDPNGRERIVTKRVRPVTFIEKISIFLFGVIFFIFF